MARRSKLRDTIHIRNRSIKKVRGVAMKKNILSPQDVINQYIETCAISLETMNNGDYKRANREYKKILKVFKFLEENLDVARASLPLLLEHENVDTRIKSAAHCIALNIFIDEAERTLENAANDESNGIYSFNAKMTLKVWREQGYLEVYVK